MRHDQPLWRRAKVSGSKGDTTRPPVWFTGGLINRNYIKKT
jgi:hypothetical protein